MMSASTWRIGLMSFLMPVIVSAASALEASGAAIDMPEPRTATNAAIHYQRAVLFLGAIQPEDREILARPIWEIITPESSEEDLAAVNRLLIAGRHATRSAIVGATQRTADFGLDIDQYLIASYMPHASAMPELARLIVLHGMKVQSNDQWRDAAVNYLLCMRMGRHLTHQTTLTEALMGVQVLETAYFALANWAVRCPDKALVEEALHIMNTAAPDMVNPARTMRFEASIAKMRLNAIQDAYPNGPWAEMVLDSLNAEFPQGGPDEIRAAAIAAATELGVPEQAFEDKESFGRFISDLRSTYVALQKESANCLALPPPTSINQAVVVFDKYGQKLLPTERASALNPVRITAHFAVHQAQLDALRLVLAVTLEKTPDGYPADLGVVRGRFGDAIPTSPYDGSDYKYKLLSDGQGFALGVAEVVIAGQELPAVRFKHLDQETTDQ